MTLYAPMKTKRSIAPGLFVRVREEPRITGISFTPNSTLPSRRLRDPGEGFSGGCAGVAQVRTLAEDERRGWNRVLHLQKPTALARRRRFSSGFGQWLPRAWIFLWQVHPRAHRHRPSRVTASSPAARRGPAVVFSHTSAAAMINRWHVCVGRRGDEHS